MGTWRNGTNWCACVRVSTRACVRQQQLPSTALIVCRVVHLCVHRTLGGFDRVRCAFAFFGLRGAHASILPCTPVLRLLLLVYACMCVPGQDLPNHGTPGPSLTPTRRYRDPPRCQMNATCCSVQFFSSSLCSFSLSLSLSLSLPVVLWLTAS